MKSVVHYPALVICEACRRSMPETQAIAYQVVEPVGGNPRELQASGQTVYECRACDSSYFVALDLEVSHDGKIP